MSRKVNYFEAKQIAPYLELSYIPVLNSRYTPMVLSAIETRKGVSFWVSDDDASRGYDNLCKYQWGLLMDAKEDIIREIRHTRGSIPDGLPTDLTSYPVGTYPGIQLVNIVGSLNTNGKSAAFILEEIRGILEAQADPENGELAQLIKIVALLSP